MHWTRVSRSAVSYVTENMQRKQQQRDRRYAYSSDAGNLFWSLFMWQKPVARRSFPHSVCHYWDIRPAQGRCPLGVIIIWWIFRGQSGFGERSAVKILKYQWGGFTNILCCCSPCPVWYLVGFFRVFFFFSLIQCRVSGESRKSAPAEWAALEVNRLRRSPVIPHL